MDGGDVTRPLDELLVVIRSRTGSSLNHVEMLTAAAPFCSPLLELLRDDLRETLSAAAEAELLEREITRMLAGPSYPTRRGSPRA